MADDGLPPLRDVVAAHGLAAKKSLGQNFLFDLNLTGKIARAAEPQNAAAMIEVGPGPGGLTRALLSHGARHVIAIERDERCLAALADISAAYPGRLTIVSGDALDIDMAALAAPYAAEGPVRICSNLPYNIGTVLLTHWLLAEPWPSFFDRLTLMFQREVAERIVATPQQRADYGRLGVLAGWRTQARILFDVPPAAFTPPPKICSSVVELRPRAAPLPCRSDCLEAVTMAAFGQRRKMVRQSLKALPYPIDVAALLDMAKIDPTRRAEELTIDDFVHLAQLVAAAAPPKQ